MQDQADGKQIADGWKAWDRFVEANTSSGFRQSSWYTSLKEEYDGWQYFTKLLRDGAEIVGGAVVFIRTFSTAGCYYYVPDGPVLLTSDPAADQEQVFDAIMASLEARRRLEPRVVSHLCINPRWERAPAFLKGFQEASHFYGSPRDTQIIDLTPSEADMLAHMKPKGRYNIRVAQRHGISVVEDTSPGGIEDFISIYDETCIRKHLGGHDHDYFRCLIGTLAEAERGSVFFAQYQGTRLAAAIVVYFAGTATYYYGGSRDAHRNMMAPYLLHYEIMRDARRRGCRRYDLFGVSPQGEPRNGWTDISVFKRKFGGQEVRVVPTLEHIYDPAAYEEWQAFERQRRNERRSRRETLRFVDAQAST